jgi:hypothetical protein
MEQDLDRLRRRLEQYRRVMEALPDERLQMVLKDEIARVTASMERLRSGTPRRVAED